MPSALAAINLTPIHPDAQSFSDRRIDAPTGLHGNRIVGWPKAAGKSVWDFFSIGLRKQWREISPWSDAKDRKVTVGAGDIGKLAGRVVLSAIAIVPRLVSSLVAAAGGFLAGLFGEVHRQWSIAKFGQNAIEASPEVRVLLRKEENADRTFVRTGAVSLTANEQHLLVNLDAALQSMDISNVHKAIAAIEQRPKEHVEAASGNQAASYRIRVGMALFVNAADEMEMQAGGGVVSVEQFLETFANGEKPIKARADKLWRYYGRDPYYGRRPYLWPSNDEMKSDARRFVDGCRDSILAIFAGKGSDFMHRPMDDETRQECIAIISERLRITDGGVRNASPTATVADVSGTGHDTVAAKTERQRPKKAIDFGGTIEVRRFKDNDAPATMSPAMDEPMSNRAETADS